MPLKMMLIIRNITFSFLHNTESKLFILTIDSSYENKLPCNTDDLTYIYVLLSPSHRCVFSFFPTFGCIYFQETICPSGEHVFMCATEVISAHKN